LPAASDQLRQQQSEAKNLNQLEAVDRLEVICATEPNDCSDDLRVFDFPEDEANGGAEELLVDNLTPKANFMGRTKSYSNKFHFSGKDPAKTRAALDRQAAAHNTSGRTSLGSVHGPSKHATN